jgi:hypothetical protein
MVQLMMQLIKNTQENQNHVGKSGAVGSNGNNENHGEGNKNNIPIQTNTRATSRVTPRPLFPHFLE